MTKTFLKLISHTKPEIQGGQRTQSWINAKAPTPRYIIFKLQEIKDKTKILKVARSGGGTPYLQRNEDKITSNLFSETMQARRE